MKAAAFLSSLFSVIVIAVFLLQQPATQTDPLFGVNAQYVNGVAPGYAPTAGSGLTLNLSAGTANCGGTIVTYSANTLTMTASTTNYVYLNTASSCVPAVKTTAFTSSDIPIAVVTAGGSAISGITDDRTMFMTMSSSGSMVWPTFTGLAKYGGSSNWVTPTYADVVALFASGSCSGYLKNDGTCGSGGGGGTSAAEFQITGSGSAPAGAGFTTNYGYAGGTESDLINNYGASSPPSNNNAFDFYSNINGVAQFPIAVLSGDGSATGSSSPATIWNLIQHSTGGNLSMGVYNDFGSPVPYFNVDGTNALWFAASNSNWMTLNPSTSLGWAGTGSVGASPSVSLSYVAAGIVGVGNGTVGDTSKAMQVASILPGILYSAAGTALPTCASGIQGDDATVKDATSPTYMGAYTSGGPITAKVICSYDGSSYAWKTH
jgi:hypothetical protein